MKKLVLFVFLFASFQAFGQFPNYTNINGRYKWIAGKFDSTFTIPSGTTPSLRTGGGTGPGALFYRTTDSTVYQYTGTQWIKLRAGVSPTDTAGIWISNVYRKTGTDSVYYVKGGTSTFAFRDSIGNVGGGGGGGKIYYFNGGVNLGTFAGLTMYELGDTAVTSAAANFTRSTTGNLANFITDVNRPGLLQIPAGVWTVDAYLSETGGGSNHAQIWIEVEKWDGSTITTIATSPIEEITNGNVIDLYTWAVSIPTTTLAVTDRIIIQFYITNTNGKTVTLYTQNGYVGEVHTTFTTGIGSLNGLTAPTQYFATGTSGTDFAISSSTATHTFNLPTASGTNRGALSSADWTTFNGKVGGSGTTNYVSKFTASGTIGNSQIFDNGTNVGIGTASPATKLTIFGTNPTFRVQGDGSSYYGGIEFYSSVSGSNRLNGSILQWDGNGLLINAGTGMNLIFRPNNGTEAMRLTSAGRLLIGTTTESTYIVDANGTVRVQGTELRLDNATTGTINLYSNTPAINFFSGGGYSISRSGTRITLNSAGSTELQIAGNSAYTLDAANGHIWRTALSGGAALARLTTGGNLIVGGTTDAGYRADIQGTLRVSGTATFSGTIKTNTIDKNDQNNPLQIYTAYNNINAIIEFWGGTGARLQYNTNTRVLFPSVNADISIGTSSLKFNNIYGTNGYFDTVLSVGTTSPNASSILDLTSTTKGFLPPRMTGAQAEAIGTPAAGLMVYSTDGSGATITSLGWWGYNGTTWVKLN